MEYAGVLNHNMSPIGGHNFVRKLQNLQTKLKYMQSDLSGKKQIVLNVILSIEDIGLM